MDLNTILPILLLAGKNGSGELVGTLMKSMKGGENRGGADVLEGLIAKKTGTPEMANVLSAMLKNKAGNRPAPRGLAPLLGFAGDDIIGKMTKFFLT